jgi:hypothetical protein
MSTQDTSDLKVLIFQAAYAGAVAYINEHGLIVDPTELGKALRMRVEWAKPYASAVDGDDLNGFLTEFALAGRKAAQDVWYASIN